MLIGSLPPSSIAPLDDERAALALGAEAVVLELQQHGDREAVVELGDVDVRRPEPGPAVQRLGRRLAPAASVMSSRSTTGNWMPGCGSASAPCGDGADQRRRVRARPGPARRW